MTAIPMNVMNFAGESVDIYNKFKDYFNQFKAVNYGSKASFDNSKSLDEKEAIVNAGLMKEIERVAGITNVSNLPAEVFAMNPNVQWATFAVVSAMVDMVLPETIIDSIGVYTDVRTGGYGDSFAFDVKPRDLFVVSKHGKARRSTEATKQFVGQKTIQTELREITVQVSLYRVLAGKESLAEFVMKVIRSMETQMAYDCYTTFDTAMSNLPTTPTNGELKVTGAFDQATFVKLAQRVAAYNGGAKPIAIGTLGAVSKILPSNANYRYDIASDYVKVGYIPNISGVDVMVLPQVADWKNPYKLALDDTKIYIISAGAQKPVKLCLEGSTFSNTTGTFDNANLTQTTTMFKSWGTGVCTNAIAAEIVLA
jgi:hypothetical protein